MIFARFRKPRIGIVLNGGGARGAYQLGFLLALKKHKLYDKVQCISGGSIGSFMSVIYLLNDPIKAIDIWKKVDNSVVRTPKSSIISSLPINGSGVFSRTGIINFIDSNFDLEKIFDSDIPVYSSLAKVVKRGKEKEYVPTYIKLNGKSHEEILNVLLATSAIPYVFDEVKYNGDTYVDCLKADNEPYLPIMSYKFDMLFIVPLTDSHYNKDYNGFSKTIVDFGFEEVMDEKMINMIDFSSDKVDDYIIKGYLVSDAILTKLKEKKKLHMETRRQRKQLIKQYYSLNTLGISKYDILSSWKTLEEIIEEVGGKQDD